MKKTIIHASLALALLMSVPSFVVSAPAAKKPQPETPAQQPKKEASKHVATGSIEHVTALSTFKEKIAKGNVVVKFSAEWCGPCKSFAPIVKEVAKDFTNVTFLAVDVDAAQEISKAYGVQSMPTVIYFKDGKEIARESGFRNKKEFTKKIKTTFNI